MAPLVWEALGDPFRYIEPFFGSGAVLLQRPETLHRRPAEIVNDADGMLTNAWRAIQYAPDNVAAAADWPVNHVDLEARRNVLLKKRRTLTGNMIADPKFYDAELAGYWIWGMSCWIGSGFMSNPKSKKIPRLTYNVGTQRLGQVPVLDHEIGVTVPRDLYAYMRALSDRLRYVKVVCGDWTRVCGGRWQVKSNQTCGVFFDPPYENSFIGGYDSHAATASDVARRVRDWCKQRGNDPNMRIVLAGYDEHDALAELGWRKVRWTATGGYGNQGGNENRHKETLWLSPHCKPVEKTT